jgi:RNA polymerase sigma-70 factor, ECF subfamily
VSKPNWWLHRPIEPRLDVAVVYREYGRMIWATLHRLGVAEADLADVMQEVLMVTHRRLPTYDGSSRLQSWLFGICTRVVANHRRRAYRRHEYASPELEPTDHSNPEVLNSLQDDRAELQAILDRIDAPKRAVLLMFEVEGLSCQQIADELGIPVGTVHSRLHGARKDFAAAVSRVGPSHVAALSTPSRRCAT